MFQSIFKDIIKSPRMRYLFIFLILITIITNCASREKLLREIDLHYGLGLENLRNGNLVQAHEEFEKIRAIAPKDDRAFAGLGLTFYLQGKFENALDYYQKAIELNPQEPEYYNNMAAALGKLGKWNDVIQFCRIALENPNYSTPEFAYYNIGCAYYNLGMQQNAIEFFKKSIEQNPTYIEPHLQLGKALSRLSDFRGAIESFKKAKTLEADAPFEDFSLQAEIEYLLGQSYLELEDRSSAKSAFESVVEKAPGSLWAEESLKILQKLQ